MQDPCVHPPPQALPPSFSSQHRFPARCLPSLHPTAPSRPQLLNRGSRLLQRSLCKHRRWQTLKPASLPWEDYWMATLRGIPPSRHPLNYSNNPPHLPALLPFPQCRLHARVATGNPPLTRLKNRSEQDQQSMMKAMQKRGTIFPVTVTAIRLITSSVLRAAAPRRRHRRPPPLPPPPPQVRCVRPQHSRRGHRLEAAAAGATTETAVYRHHLRRHRLPTSREKSRHCSDLLV